MTCSAALFVTFSLTLGYKVPCTHSWLQNLLGSMHSAPHGRGYRGPSLLRGSLLRPFQVDQPYRQQMTCIGAHFITFSFVLGYKAPLGAEPRMVWSTLWVVLCLPGLHLIPGCAHLGLQPHVSLVLVPDYASIEFVVFEWDKFGSWYRYRVHFDSTLPSLMLL